MSALVAARADTRMLVIEAYRCNPDVRAVAASLGLSTIRVYLHLKISGVLLTEDAARIGAKGSMLGAQGEQEFKRLVPKARDMNAEVRENHPGYDFELGSQKIDVKACTFKGQSKGSKRNKNWGIEIGSRQAPGIKAADLYVVFALLGKQWEGGYRLFVMPAELIGDRRYICITHGIESMWNDFEVQPNDLADVLGELGQMA